MSQVTQDHIQKYLNTLGPGQYSVTLKGEGVYVNDVLIPDDKLMPYKPNRATRRARLNKEKP